MERSISTQSLCRCVTLAFGIPRTVHAPDLADSAKLSIIDFDFHGQSNRRNKSELLCHDRKHAKHRPSLRCRARDLFWRFERRGSAISVGRFLGCAGESRIGRLLHSLAFCQHRRRFADAGLWKPHYSTVSRFSAKSFSAEFCDGTGLDHSLRLRIISLRHHLAGDHSTAYSSSRRRRSIPLESQPRNSISLPRSLVEYRIPSQEGSTRRYRRAGRCSA